MSVDIPFGNIPKRWSHISTDGPWIRVPYSDQFTKDEYERIRKGFVPESIDERWIVFSSDEWTWACRTLGGDCVFAYRFQSDGDIVSVKDAYASLSSFSEHGQKNPSFILEGIKAVLRCYILEEEDVFFGLPFPFDSDSNQ